MSWEARTVAWVAEARAMLAKKWTRGRQFFDDIPPSVEDASVSCPAHVPVLGWEESAIDPKSLKKLSFIGSCQKLSPDPLNGMEVAKP